MHTHTNTPLTVHLCSAGVFGDTDEVKSVSVVKGDAVTLQTGLNKERYEVILCNFNDIRIAMYDRDIGAICLYDGVGGIFRNRLKVDNETASLTIRYTTTEHTGCYEADIIRRWTSHGLSTQKSSKKFSTLLTPQKNYCYCQW